MLTPKKIYTVLASILVITIVGFFYIGERNKEENEVITSELSFSKYITDSLVKNITFKEAGIFLYTDDYKERYLVASNREITNPINNVDKDPFYSIMLEYNKYNVCTNINVERIPEESGVYRDLQKAGYLNRKEPVFFMACPLFVKRTLVGYISTVVVRKDLGLSENLQSLKYYAALTSKNISKLL